MTTLDLTVLPTNPGLAPEEIAALQAEVRELARQRNAVILAHNYQVPEMQDVADFVGDSLGLAIEATRVKADAIVMCGVYFMAETAKILNPERTVLIPDQTAGCSLADSITADDVRAWKAEHPGAVVVSYVNTTAAIKAESDYCVTSGNAEQVIRSIPEDKRFCSCPTSSSAPGSRRSWAARTWRSGWASATSTPASAPRSSSPASRPTRTPSC